MPIVTAVIGLIAGNLTILLFFPQVRKGKQLENETKQIENYSKQASEWERLYREELLRDSNQAAEWEKHYKEEREDNKAKDAKIDSLYSIISEGRNREAEKDKKIAELEVRITTLAILKCEVPGCPKRQPPTGY